MARAPASARRAGARAVAGGRPAVRSGASAGERALDRLGVAAPERRHGLGVGVGGDVLLAGREPVEEAGGGPLAGSEPVEEAGGDLGGRRYSVATIAPDVGYTSEFAFNRAFARHRGEPPGRYRRAAREASAGASARSSPTRARSSMPSPSSPGA